MKTFGKRIRQGLAAALAGTLCLAAGCATIRRAREVQRGENIPPGERTVTAAEIGLSSNTVLTMAEAERLARLYHPSMTQASQNLAVAESQYREARAEYGPTLSSSAGYSEGSSNTEENPSGGKNRTSISGSLTLDITLIDFGRTSASLRQAGARRIAAAAGWLAARNQAVYGARSAFLNLAKAQELGQVAEGAVRQYRAHLEQVKAFAEAGRSIRYDVTKAEVDLGNAELSLINARSEISNARAALNQSLGLAENPGYAIAPGAIPEFPCELASLMNEARRNHPDLRALKAQEQAASAAVDRAIADLYPDLGLRAQYGGTGSGLPLVWNWSAALSSAFQWFTGGQQTAKVDEAAAQLRSARAQTAQREQQIYLELSRAVNQWDSAARRQQLTELIVRQAQESLNLIGERYNLKAASAVELTDAQVALTSAQAEQVKARFDYETAKALIHYTVGENEP